MYIGNDLQIAHPSYKIIDDISSGFNGSTTSFALQVSGATPVPFPISTQQVMISVNGVVQEPDPTGSAGFKLLGSNIVFSSAPANGHAFFGVINAGADYVTAGSEFPDGSATAPSFTFQDDQDTGWFRSGSGAVGYSANGVQTLTFDGNGLTVTGDASFVGDSSKNLLWDKSDGALEFADNARIKLGTGGDLEIFHDGSNSYILNITADLRLKGAYIKLRGANDENMITATQNGAVELFHDNVKKFETTSVGAQIDGRLVVNNSGYGALIVMNNDDSADGSYINLVNDSSSPADNDVLGLVNFKGNDSAGNETAYANIRGISTDVTDGSESADITFSTRHSNTFAERMRLDSSGRLLVGVTASRAVNEAQGSFQIEGTGAEDSDMSIIRNQANSGGPALCFGKSRNASLGGNTVVNDDDQLGAIIFNGNDGTDLASQGARIDSYVDGTPGSNDMPGRLVFSTTADGASTSTERMRIDSTGDVGIGTTNPSAYPGKLAVVGDGIVCDREVFSRVASSVSNAERGFLQHTDGAEKLHLYAENSVAKLDIWASTAITWDQSQNTTFAGTVSDSIGELRQIPQRSVSSVTLAASDVGKAILATSTVTVPNGVFSSGDAVTIINNSGGDITISKGISTMYLASDGSSANRTLATRGMATIWFSSSTVAYISGAGLS